jgi:hypothetical protein
MVERIYTRVYDPAEHIWVAPVIGYWDKLGYTRCLGCPPPPERHDVVIYADNSAADDAACDFCHAPLAQADEHTGGMC